ncbi:MAG TPA: c-type cytochrome [Gemmatimonadaceae bacterium]|jgi:cytochrome c
MRIEDRGSKIEDGRRAGRLLAIGAIGCAVLLSACEGGRTAQAEPVRHYAIGRAATTAEVAAWSTEIGPDGAELPTGSGNATTGAAIYAAKCANCHGPKGEGMEPAYPALIGRDPKGENFPFASDFHITRTIGNYWPYATTVFDYVRRAMPLTQPGSLSNDEVYSLTAFLLSANQVIPAGSTLDAASLRAVKMPYVDRFVRDDRRGGHEVR